METTGYFINRTVELTTCMENGIDDTNRRYLLSRMDIHRHTTAVILDADASVLLEGDMDLAAKACQLLINGIVQNLPY